jgi:hypothetical protein
MTQQQDQISKVKYAGVYTGPAYGNPWDPSFEGFTSLAEAEQRFRERQESSGTYPLSKRSLNVALGIITSTTEESAYWPATSPQDTIGLYRVFEGEIAGEPFLRLSAGPRGGVVRENY